VTSGVAHDVTSYGQLLLLLPVSKGSEYEEGLLMQLSENIAKMIRKGKR
jgi:hypothetical protein